MSLRVSVQFVLQQEKQGQGSAGREKTLWWRGGGVRVL